MDTAEDPRVRTVTPPGRATLPGPILAIHQEATPRGLEAIPRGREVTHQAQEVTHQAPQDLVAILHHQAQEAIPRGLEVTLLQLGVIRNHLDLVVILLHPLEVQEVTHLHPMLTRVLPLLVHPAALILDS